MSEGGWVPKSWGEAGPYLVWYVLILGCGLEGMAHLFNGELWTAGTAFLAMFALSALMIHWAQIKASMSVEDRRWLVVVSLVVIMALALSPFIEQRHWPFIDSPKIIHDAPTADEIAKAAAPVVDAAKQQIASIQSQLATTIKERDDARNSASPSPPPPVPPTLDDIAKKISIWRSVDSQMSDLEKIVNAGYKLTDNWPENLKSDRAGVLQSAENFEAALTTAITKSDSLRNAYLNYSDVSDTLNRSGKFQIFRQIDA